MRRVFVVPALLLASACATTGGTPGDPYEKFNRKMWAFDETADRAVLKPVAKGYRAVMPGFLRRGLSNMLSNVSEPFSFGNAALQGKPKRALNILGRFVINTTVGIGGFRDVASKVGYPKMQEDLGQTFAVWGVKKSPYLVLPLFGPSTIRDGVGSIAAQWADPYRIVLRDHLGTVESLAVTSFEFVDARANLIDTGADTLLETSADTYAVTRSAYLQRRAAMIADDDSAAGGGGDDAALNAALDELGGDGAAPADGTPAEPTATSPAPVPTTPAGPAPVPSTPR